MEEAMVALNVAQRIFVLLTLCLERTRTFNLTANFVWYQIFEQFDDFLVPLRITNSAGVKLRPYRLQELDAEDDGWISATGQPNKYATLGFEWMAISPHPTATGTMSIVYAKCPATLSQGAYPEIPEEYHACLIDGAIAILRSKEGAQELEKALPNLDRFLKDAEKCAEFIRGRNLAARYDALPFELRTFDRSKLLKIMKASRERKPAHLDIKQAEAISV